MSARVGIVTGANKGIGLEIARKLGREQGWLCVLTARDEERGRSAAESLLSEGAGVRFRQLDISDPDSRERFAKDAEQEFTAGIDALVNNAGFAFKGSDPTPFAEQAEPTMDINFFSTVATTERLLPLVKRSPHGRIVNVASMSGHLRIVPDAELRAKFASAGQPGGLGHDELMLLARGFVQDVKEGKHKEKGWPNSCYGMSKLCLIAYTKILAAREPTLKVNACCPGYVATDMSGQQGHKRPDQGALTPFMLATGALDGTSGGFWSDEKRIDW
ncbi:hypothetical protein JKP88DRAFT_225951 [Tribonema minus]|uniref:Uncharacterized protein n=1 Tax=Tribonema minus TaxID=303371 RepID=A0A836C9X3_9STRA|nr:hypothetical protein JKP88DRAFT_225951 [Tribonema minus]